MKRIALIVALAAAACGPKRTTAASQPTPAAFDATASEPKALATADAGIAALGGLDKWLAVKELRFELKYSKDGKVQGWFKHRWDRWNGRHDFATADPRSIEADPSKASWFEVKYDLYNADRIPYASSAAGPLSDADGTKYAEVARDRLNKDGYLALVYYKLRDPGVHLADGGELKDIASAPDLCKPSCVGVRITFDPKVGQDTWQVDYNSESHLPQLIERVVPQGRIAYRIDGWADAGGLKFPTKLTNVGMPDEIFTFGEYGVGEPQDSAYEAPVDRSGGASTAATSEHQSSAPSPQEPQ